MFYLILPHKVHISHHADEINSRNKLMALVSIDQILARTGMFVTFQNLRQVRPAFGGKSNSFVVSHHRQIGLIRSCKLITHENLFFQKAWLKNYRIPPIFRYSNDVFNDFDLDAILKRM